MKRAPLNWLQAFEATGRTGSLKAAAQELSVSPSTISHQVRDLEAYLGILLFSRGHRAVTLTEEGKNLLPALTLGFQSIRNASTQSSQSRKTLAIGAFPFLANEILTPNISTLAKEIPDTEFRIYTHNDLSSLTHTDPNERLDVVIRYAGADNRFPGFQARKLADVSLVPVIGPTMSVAADVDSILSQKLIRVIGPFQGWQVWQDRFAPKSRSPSFSLETDSFHSAMLAVERNEGLCLGIMPHLSSWIAAGRLVAMDEFTVAIEDQSVHAVYASFQQHNPAIERLVTWLSRQLQQPGDT